MNCTYSIICEELIVDDDYFKSYGIECKINKYYSVRIYDITFSLNKISELCNFLNINKISPTHFKDVIEDFLADN